MRQSAFDEMIRISASWDWVTPLVTVYQNWQNRPSVEFTAPFGYSLSAREIAQMLTKKGIHVWGVMVISDTITFRVREAQSRYASYWLHKTGIPFSSGYNRNQRRDKRGRYK